MLSSVPKVGLINILCQNVCYCQGKAVVPLATGTGCIVYYHYMTNLSQMVQKCPTVEHMTWDLSTYRALGFSPENGFSPKMASPQKMASPRKWFLPKKGFSPEMASPQK